MGNRHFENYIQRGVFKRDLCNKIKSDKALFDYILSSQDFDIRVRGNEIHIYYNGGKILEVRPRSFYFDSKYELVKSANLERTASEIHKEAENKKELDMRKASILLNPSEYFKYAKGIMDEWFLWNKKQERKDQHNISSRNRILTESNNLVVVDIEFAVSYNSYVYNKTYEDRLAACNHKIIERYPNPRFDIIAVDKEGQLYVLELKTGLDSVANMKKHLDDFNNFVGSNGFEEGHDKMRWQVFVEEMQLVLDKLKQYFGYPQNLYIDTDKRPIFMFAYTDKEEFSEEKKLTDRSEFKNMVTRCCPDTPIVWVDNHNYYLNL